MSWKNNVKNWDGKLYKVLQGNKSCHGGDFEWSLPKDGKPGDWTPVIENVEMCESGYHLTTHYTHWSDVDGISVYEAEGDVVEFDGYDKVVCTRVRLLRLVEDPFNKDNVGIRNSGNYNFGNYNSGSYNSGFRNSGNYNSGSWNSGYFCTWYNSDGIFDKPIPENWKPKFPEWIYFELLQEGYYALWQKAFENADIEGIKELLALPNFNYKIFEEITSITKEQIEKKFPNSGEVTSEEKSLRESAKVACEKILGEFYLLIKNNVALPEILKMAAEKAFLDEVEDENTDIIRKSLKTLEQDGILV